MVNISLVVFFLVLQLLLVSVLLAVFALLKVRSLSARLAGQRSAPAPSQPNDVARYLATELQRTRGRLETLGGAVAPGVDSSPGRLALRIELLQMEVEWAGLGQYDASAWSKLDARLQGLLGREPAAPPAAPAATAPAGVVGEVATKQLFDEQQATIEQLKADITAAVSNPDSTESLRLQLDKLARTARELTFCVAILEDENLFLRDQVVALLKED